MRGLRVVFSVPSASPRFSHLLVTKRRKGRPDKARDPQAGAPGPRKRTVRYVEEADGGGTRFCGSHSQDGSLRRCSRRGVTNAG